MKISHVLARIVAAFWPVFDRLVPKRTDFWAFSTHHLDTGKFIESQRALFEAVKKENGIKKLIFYRGSLAYADVEDAVNYEFLDLQTWRGLYCLARCKVVLLTHSISMDFSLRWGARSYSVLRLHCLGRVVVNLSHGISLKSLNYTSSRKMLEHLDRNSYKSKERLGYAGMLASSDIHGYAMAAMFHPVNFQQIWVTGFPRNDFLLMADDSLPRYLSENIGRIRNLTKGRRLVLYAPTYRQTRLSPTAYYYQFSPAEIDALRSVLMRHDAVLAYRPHYFGNDSSGTNLDRYIDGELIVDASKHVVDDVSALVRESDIIMTDYSSVYVDGLYIDKPGICFAYDLDEYNSNQDGVLYDLDLIFPGAVFRTFDQCVDRMDRILSGAMPDDGACFSKKMLYKHIDFYNSRRVIERILESTSGNGQF
ncbi:CDP-glycerol glycerophosphotransferase family protein [Castellaniella hirudinis]|uniref:CDP-glycerol glycerophosphotransferase family protein n=1 Tax=Castellaniella hirudinis TaxID=1144617 RepID=UPI0039C41D75